MTPRMRLDPQTAAASAGPRHSGMMRAILRGYHLGEPDQTHAVRLVGSTFHGCISLELAGGFDHSRPDSQQSWTRVMDALDPCCAPGLGSDPRPFDPEVTS
ncbi:TetR-like C-terminal domain-containing protein [Micromonospora sp. BQ11]|uniref:TetR-like C-terminal domain-containing protein n=1 Tax=Micromonospora sp. BQ11 TaxID=3452212 RepID=UPI003F8CDCB6